MRIVIQERDIHLLRELEVMRLGDREQAKLVAGFGSTTRANARLLKLVRAGFLSRAFVGTPRRGMKAVYTLSKKGEALVEARRPGLTFRQHGSLTGSLNLDHQQQINEVFLTVKYRPIPLAHVRFLTWKAFFEPLTKSIPLIPDGYFELEHHQELHPVFVEVDLGSERLRVWREKVRNYIKLAISGEFRRIFSRKRFRVLAVTTSNRRLTNLRRATAKVTSKILWLSTVESVTGDGFWSASWLRPQGEDRLPLFKE